MRWPMDENERAACYASMGAMQRTELEIRTLKAELFRLEQQRLALDRQQNLWMLLFAIKHGIPLGELGKFQFVGPEVVVPDQH